MVKEMKRWRKQLFCLHSNWRCLDKDAHWFGWQLGRRHECMECGQIRVFERGREPVSMVVTGLAPTQGEMK